ncbi:uncharacterized protein PGTG_07750 [Puccinia graminis f. sp. tritici CRL 75-36-700-3]|uniref:Uncharacterized protein n=1 Tax=Puccinia graminis f. sp. tritici (strain CRL 75-36-700-3 / race SCCL) TaxID=418459 RepID=E3KBK5_PUCGT|nr:uncharacterized protein PGTG_07750 [Puccinia graminis f. sp. tritici CRL 75-36-700-3]EFP81501.2 hypothetical protein PGTG_07750 [Puccinia graminis f. sp. tritici CRL 75-36-700-3]
MASIHASIPLHMTRQVSFTDTSYTVLYSPPPIPSTLNLESIRETRLCLEIHVDSQSWDILPDPVHRHTLSPIMTGTMCISKVSPRIEGFSLIKGPDFGPTFVLHASPLVNKEHLMGLIPSNVILYSGAIAFEKGRSLHIAAETIELFHNYQNPHTYNLRSRSFYWSK